MRAAAAVYRFGKGTIGVASPVVVDFDGACVNDGRLRSFVKKERLASRKASGVV